MLEAVVENSLSFAWVKKNVLPKPAILLIHGWAMSSTVWETIKNYIEQDFDVYALDLPGHGVNSEIEVDSINELLCLFDSSILPDLPQNFSVIGWSLGGVVATYLAEKHQSRVNALITVATTPKYISDEKWKYGFNEKALDLFIRYILVDSKKVLRQFMLMQLTNAPNVKKEKQWLNEIIEGNSYGTTALGKQLKWFKVIDIFPIWKALDLPVANCFGSNDPLIPVETANELIEQFPEHKVFVFESSAHAPFYSEAKSFANKVKTFLLSSYNHNSCQPLIKRHVKMSFERSAENYDELANFQKHENISLIEFAREVNVLQQEVLECLDLGAGTGFFRQYIQQNKIPVTVYELDISMAMLKQSQMKADNSLQLCADIEALPIANNRFDMVFSSLVLQWITDFDAVLQQLSDVIKPSGFIVTNILVDGSLQELKDSSKELGDENHVNVFLNESEVLEKFKKYNFSVKRHQTRNVVEKFSSVDQMLKSIRGIGAGNHLKRSNKLLSRKKYNNFIHCLNEMRLDSGEIPLTYRVMSLVVSNKK